VNLHQTSTTRTSVSHPLFIATMEVGQGAIGVTFCPGKRGDSVFGAPWERDLHLDLNAIELWGGAAVVTLVESHELDALGVPDLGTCVQRRGLQWHHLPIRDLDVPDAAFEATWPAVASQLRQMITQGQKVVVHCRGGRGRAGTVAACLFVEFGVSPKEAIKRVRAVRPHAIETVEQERYVLGYQAPVAKASFEF